MQREFGGYLPLELRRGDKALGYQVFATFPVAGMATLSRAYGFHSERVERTEDFAAAFARAMASGTGAVLDLNISPEALTPRQTLSQMRAAALKAKETA